MKPVLSLTLLFSLAIRSHAGEAKVQIDAAFPGGNIVVDQIKGDEIFLHQDLRDTAGDWFYWYFRARGGQGRSLTFHFTKGNPIGVRGPAVSIDAGKSWRWLGAQAVRGASFQFNVPKDAMDVRFCFAFPYVGDNLHAFLKRHAKDPRLSVELLCKSKKNRDIELLKLGRLDGKASQRVVLTCRHHACEMMASYVLEGIIDEVLADGAAGKWLSGNVEFFIVPMIDKDGVEDGDQGKNRKPRDPNRDYDGDSIYPAQKAIRAKLSAWAAGKLRFAMDMHCPWIRGDNNETVYFVGTPDAKIFQEVTRFSKVLEENQSGPLVFSSKNNLPYGKGWNGKANYTGKPFSWYASEIPGVRAATTIEVAYANANGKAVTDESARALGRDLARTLHVYLKSRAD